MIDSGTFWDWLYTLCTVEAIDSGTFWDFFYAFFC